MQVGEQKMSKGRSSTSSTAIVMTDIPSYLTQIGSKITNFKNVN